MFIILSKSVVQKNTFLATIHPSVIFAIQILGWQAVWICELIALLRPVSIFK